MQKFTYEIRNWKNKRFYFALFIDGEFQVESGAFDSAAAAEENALENIRYNIERNPNYFCM